MSRKRFTEEFKIEAVRQVTERGFGARDVAERLGVSPNSLYAWIKQFGIEARLLGNELTTRTPYDGVVCRSFTWHPASDFYAR